MANSKDSVMEDMGDILDGLDDDELESSQESLQNKAKVTSGNEYKRYGLPAEFLPKDKERKWYKLLPVPRTEEEKEGDEQTGFFWLAKIHVLGNPQTGFRPYLCHGKDCRTTPGMPCFVEHKLYVDPLLQAFRDDPKGMDRDSRLEAETKDGIRKKLRALAGHFYLLANVTPAVVDHDGAKMIEWPECYGDRANRSEDDTQCAACAFKDHCSSAIRIQFHKYFPGNEKNSGHNLFECWNESKLKRKAVYNVRPDKNGECPTRFVRVTCKGVKLNTSRSFRIPQDSDVMIPNHVMVAWMKQLHPNLPEKRVMADIVKQGIEVGKEELIEITHATVAEIMDDPAGFDPSMFSQESPGMDTPERKVRDIKADDFLSDDEEKKDEPEEEPEEDDEEPEEEEEDDEGNVEGISEEDLAELINDPDNYAIDPETEQPVCRGHFYRDADGKKHKRWAKCKVEDEDGDPLDEDDICPIRSICLKESNKKEKGEKSTSTSNTKKKSGGEPWDDDSKDPKDRCQLWADAENRGKVWPCFGKKPFRKPGKGRCVECEEKKTVMFELCGEAIDG